MGIHENFIGGNWTEASTAAPNVNPSNTRDIVGEYAAAREMMRTGRSRW
jgi:aldehyde dehydrogenase (NAD+)